MGKIETKTSAIEVKDDKEEKSLSIFKKKFYEKFERLEKLSREFSEKVQELKEACLEVRKMLSE